MKKRLLCIILTLIMLIGACPAFGAESLSLSGKAAVIMDCDTGYIIYENNADIPRAPASMTKMMSLYSFFSRMEQKGITLQTKVTISKSISELSKKAGLSNVPFDEGEVQTVDTLLKAACVVSANAAVVALGTLMGGSESGFVNLMNADAAALGLTAHFSDASGLSDKNSITPRSMAILCRAIVRDYPQILDYTSLKTFSFKGKNYSSTNKNLEGLANGYPGTDGLKTGYTGAAGYCISVTSEREGRRIVAVTMGCPNMEGRTNDGYAMLRYGFRNLEQTVEPIYGINGDFSRNGEIVTVKLSNVPQPFAAKISWIVDGETVMTADNAWIGNGEVMSAEISGDTVEFVISVGKYNVLLTE
ncbi:MAG: D-alanyl-D-alanine carboxypeptidase family protein [Clostridia bacterium]